MFVFFNNNNIIILDNNRMAIKCVDYYRMPILNLLRFIWTRHSLVMNCVLFLLFFFQYIFSRVLFEGRKKNSPGEHVEYTRFMSLLANAYRISQIHVNNGSKSEKNYNQTQCFPQSSAFLICFPPNRRKKTNLWTNNWIMGIFICSQDRQTEEEKTYCICVA